MLGVDAEVASHWVWSCFSPLDSLPIIGNIPYLLKVTLAFGHLDTEVIESIDLYRFSCFLTSAFQLITCC